MAVEPSALPVIAVVVAVPPIRPVVATVIISGVVTVAVVRPTVVVGAGTIIVVWSVEDRNRNWKAKSEVDTGARSRLSEKRKSRDNEQKYNELFHSQNVQTIYHGCGEW
jgi:hypothetical protein